jgi:SAM-dependent methyltransferase
MSTSFADHFSEKPAQYAASRPTYPAALFAAAAAAAPGLERAWDCATGNGQAAHGLARHFARVEATDASAQQIEHAIPAPNVRYSVQPAEATDFAPASFDAVCVAQALHWFDVDRFYAEVKRVLRPRGILLVTAYGWSGVSPEFDAEQQRIVIDPIEPYWPPQNQLIMRGYRDLAFPFELIEMPPMSIEVRWTLDQYVDYMGTWTATRRLLEKQPGFLANARAELRKAWPGNEARKVTMPLVVLCGRHA